MINCPNQTWAKWASSLFPHVNAGGARERQVLICFSFGTVSFVYYIHKSFLTSFSGRIREGLGSMPPAGHKQRCLSSFWLEVTFLLHKHENL